MMELDNKDKEIRDKIQSFNDLPDEISWNPEKGWESYKTEYKANTRTKMIYWVSSAAAVILVIILLNIVPGKNNQTIKVATDTEKNSITLNDGSRVWLNRNTKVTVDQRNDKIRLTGEAYFEFTGETQYQIKTQHGNFTAKLADFNLSSREKSQRATLAVTNGKVTAIWNKEKELKSTVTSGMQADIVPNIILAISPLEDPNYLAWKTGRLNFENTPLFYVVKKLEKLNNIQIKIENKTLRYCRMNSEFHSTDVKKVLNEIPNYLDCKVLKKGNKYIIKGKGCNHNDM